MKDTNSIEGIDKIIQLFTGIHGETLGLSESGKMYFHSHRNGVQKWIFKVDSPVLNNLTSKEK